MIFNMVGGAGGSGDELGFTVVGGTSAPSNPSENTVWINTSAEITSWLFDVTTPSNPSEGMVWISTGKASTAEFDAITENGLQVYPLSSRQYVNGSWVKKEATVYRGGKWVKSGYWLIGNGVNAKAVTGGFPIDWHTDWQVFNSDGSVTLKHSYGDATFRHDYWTYNTFDVTNYKKLVVRATSWSTNEAINVGINTVANRGNSCISKVTIGGVPSTVTLDISSITGYVCFQVDMPYNGYSITLSEVYFEA